MTYACKRCGKENKPSLSEPAYCESCYQRHVEVYYGLHAGRPICAPGKHEFDQGVVIYNSSGEYSVCLWCGERQQIPPSTTHESFDEVIIDP